MVSTHAERCAELDALYAELPPIDCKGKCSDSCGPIEMTHTERRRIAEAGVSIPPVRRPLPMTPIRCPGLSQFDTCTVYALRPLICRLWGLTRAMRCSYGCIPEGGYLTELAALELITRVHDIAGERERAAGIREGIANGRLLAWEARQREAANWREFNEIRGFNELNEWIR